MPMIDSDKFKSALDAKAAAKALLVAVFEEWQQLNEELQQEQTETFNREIDIAERRYLLACERVVNALESEIKDAVRTVADEALCEPAS